jgi:hypothetical protein
MRLFLTLILAATTTAAAQSTWHGVHFGESRDDVRTQLTAQNLPVEASQEGTLQSNTDYELPIPGLRHTFPMFVSFHFDDNNALADVSLTLDVPGMHRYWAIIGSDESLFNFAEEHLIGALSGLYGTPLYRSSACDAEPKQPAPVCIYSWRGSDQTVQLERLTTPRGQRLVIRYQPLATDL